MIPKRITGVKAQALPDDGPWQLLKFKDQVFALSQISGLYAVEATSLRRIELQEVPPESNDPRC